MIVVTVPGIPPSPNQQRREHWARRAAEARGWRQAALYAALDARNRHADVPFPLHSAAIRVVIVSPTTVRRDPDNAIASVKPIIDGLVRAGILADDSFAVVRDLSVAVERGREAAVRIEVTP